MISLKDLTIILAAVATLAACGGNTGVTPLILSPEFAQIRAATPVIDGSLERMNIDVTNPEKFTPDEYGRPWFLYWVLGNRESGFYYDAEAVVGEAFLQSGLFQSSGGSTLTLDAKMIELLDNSVGYNIKITFAMRYVLRDESGDTLFDKLVRSTGQASFDEYFDGGTRGMAATQRAVKANLIAALNDMKTGIPEGLKEIKLRHEMLAEIQANLKQVNETFRVVESNAVARQLPDASAEKLDSYPLGSVIHVIGELPSGWKQLAREGKPYGWVHKRSLREMASTGDGATTVAPVSAAKPSIFLAYPKGEIEVAEDTVNVLGYVTAENRTQDFDISVNRFPLKVSSLWTGSALETRGLRGYPLELAVPLQPGQNRIELQVKDTKGFVVRTTITVKRIELAEATPASAVVTSSLPERLPNITVANRDTDVSAENFMVVLGSWVKDTAKTDYNKGNTMFDQGRFARAAYYYRKSIKTDTLGQAWFNLGISQKALGQKTEANEAFAAACRMEIQQACDVAS